MLDKNKLKNLILDVVSNSYPTSVSEAVEMWSDIYHSYAIDAEDGSGDNPIITNKIGFQSLLSVAFNSGNYFTASSSFENAISTYWTGAVFNILKIPIGSISKISSAIIIPPIPSGALYSVFSDVSINGTADQKAQEIADIIDSITKTGRGIINHLIPGAPPFPGVPINFNIQ